MNEEPIIGIDLGTTNSLVGVMDAGFSVIIPDEEGRRLLPSVVAWKKGEPKPFVGYAAIGIRNLNPSTTIVSAKRFMGRRWSELSPEEKQVDFSLKPDEHGGVLIDVLGQSYSPVHIAAFLLAELKARAEKYLERSVRKAVISVPAYFNDAQRHATKQAGELAGLEVVRILSEPTAAALAYGIDRQHKQAKIAVYDFGGGTFDCSILELNAGVFQVLATNGNTLLGGDDIDQALFKHLWEQLPTELRSLSEEDEGSIKSRIREAAGTAKIKLSTQSEVVIEIPFLTPQYHFKEVVSQTLLEILALPIIEKTHLHCQRAMGDAGLKIEDLQKVILVGGQTRMPLVQAKVRQWFNCEPDSTMDPDEAVAKGVVVQAGILSGAVSGMVLLDVTPLSLGIETFGGLMNVIIPRNSSIPTKVGELFTNAVDNQRSMKISVLQGERELAKDNWLLGEFDLEFQPGARATARLGVQFDLDANGILHVLARDTATGAEKKVEISSAVDVTDTKVEQMVSESIEHAFEDMHERQWIEQSIKGKRLFTITAKVFQDHEKDLDKGLISNLKEALDRLEKALNSKNLENLKHTIKELDQVSKPLAEHVMDQALNASLRAKELIN